MQTVPALSCEALRIGSPTSPTAPVPCSPRSTQPDRRMRFGCFVFWGCILSFRMHSSPQVRARPAVIEPEPHSGPHRPRCGGSWVAALFRRTGVTSVGGSGPSRSAGRPPRPRTNSPQPLPRLRRCKPPIDGGITAGAGREACRRLRNSPACRRSDPQPRSLDEAASDRPLVPQGLARDRRLRHG